MQIHFAQAPGLAQPSNQPPPPPAACAPGPQQQPGSSPHTFHQSAYHSQGSGHPGACHMPPALSVSAGQLAPPGGELMKPELGNYHSSSGPPAASPSPASSSSTSAAASACISGGGGVAGTGGLGMGTATTTATPTATVAVTGVVGCGGGTANNGTVTAGGLGNASVQITPRTPHTIQYLPTASAAAPSPDASANAAGLTTAGGRPTNSAEEMLMSTGLIAGSEPIADQMPSSGESLTPNKLAMVGYAKKNGHPSAGG
ncbi:unnamed protein product [Protopolystoma xenopodis]|uniref:Uncharacterized protein n=1 Tax=Protopolystoma xenopodis TaxID=117903 RepID=A0A3S5BTZ0_9PLAT|nr:unnamed protein product [Protopolystoma xenopodis]